jgi:hypothetical protein
MQYTIFLFPISPLSCEYASLVFSCSCKFVGTPSSLGKVRTGRVTTVGGGYSLERETDSGTYKARQTLRVAKFLILSPRRPFRA